MTKITTKKGDSPRAVGRRKRASARVRLALGEGKLEINGKSYIEYFPFQVWQNTVLAPIVALAKVGAFDITARVAGGGKSGQAKAVQHGIARVLAQYNEEWRKTLKTLGFLTRDPRIKERKKFGLKRARRAPQWSKR